MKTITNKNYNRQLLRILALSEKYWVIFSNLECNISQKCDGEDGFAQAIYLNISINETKLVSETHHHTYNAN